MTFVAADGAPLPDVESYRRRVLGVIDDAYKCDHLDRGVVLPLLTELYVDVRRLTDLIGPERSEGPSLAPRAQPYDAGEGA